MPNYSRKIAKPIYVPKKLKEIVEGLSKTDKRNVVLIYKTIENLHKRDNIPLNHFKEIPVKYLKKKVFRYSKPIEILIENGIIERSEDYNFIGKRQCYSYRIIDEVLEEFKLTSYSELPDDRDDILSEAKRRQIRNTLNKCKVDKDAAFEWIDCYVQELTIDDFTTNYKINFEYINLKLPGKTVRMSLNTAILDAMSEGKVIVNTKKQDCIMAYPEDFIKQKRRELEQEYKQQIDLLKRGIYSISRSPLNYRVYHNLCNLKKELLKFVTLDGQKLVNIDVVNSQLAILANVIENKVNYEPGWTFPDVTFTENDQKFLKLAKEGGLYEFVQEMLGLQTRKQAKSQTFETLFAHCGKLSIELYQFKQQFPGIINWIDQFKRLNNRLNGENHRSTLPIFLQRVESCLIIDELWDQIPQGVPYLTVHDSFLTTDKNSQMFQNLINSKLDCKVAA